MGLFVIQEQIHASQIHAINLQLFRVNLLFIKLKGIAFLKATIKMKFKLKNFTGIFTIVAIAAGVFCITNTKANVIDDAAKKKKFVACETANPGGPTQYGNTCDSGSSTCYSNPCD